MGHCIFQFLTQKHWIKEANSLLSNTLLLISLWGHLSVFQPQCHSFCSASPTPVTNCQSYLTAAPFQLLIFSNLSLSGIKLPRNIFWDISFIDYRHENKDCGQFLKSYFCNSLQILKRKRYLYLKATDFKPVYIELAFEKQIQTSVSTFGYKPTFRLACKFQYLVEAYSDKILFFFLFNRDFFSIVLWILTSLFSTPK